MPGEVGGGGPQSTDILMADGILSVGNHLDHQRSRFWLKLASGIGELVDRAFAPKSTHAFR